MKPDAILSAPRRSSIYLHYVCTTKIINPTTIRKTCRILWLTVKFAICRADDELNFQQFVPVLLSFDESNF